MFIIPIMVVIGALNHNNLWLYIALGISTTGAVLKAGQAQAQKKLAADHLKNGVEDLLKSLRATQN